MPLFFHVGWAAAMHAYNDASIDLSGESERYFEVVKTWFFIFFYYHSFVCLCSKALV